MLDNSPFFSPMSTISELIEETATRSIHIFCTLGYHGYIIFGSKNYFGAMSTSLLSYLWLDINSVTAEFLPILLCRIYISN